MPKISKYIFLGFFFCRGELTLKTTFVWIAGMILLSCLESAPLFFMAQISPLVSFQEEVQMQNILICREVWTKGSRVAYKTFSCVFQFIIPLFFVVSRFDGLNTNAPKRSTCTSQLKRNTVTE